MKFNRYILSIIAISIIVFGYNSLKQKPDNRVMVGIRPGNRNSHVPMGRPFWN